MVFRLAGESGSFILLAIASVGLAACSSAPTAPSSRSANEAAPSPATASVPAASAAAGGAEARAADSIKITRGTLAHDSALAGSGTVTLRGSHGFRFEGRTLSGLPPSFYCGTFNPCEAGLTVPFTVRWVGTDIPGTARVQGEDFVIQGQDGTSLSLELTGTVVTPAHLTDRVAVTVPFTASGLLHRGASYPGIELTGDGLVTFTLEWQPFIGGWAITYSSFDFGNGRAD